MSGWRLLQTKSTQSLKAEIKTAVCLPVRNNFKGMEKLLKRYIDEGILGKLSCEGFYKYD